MNRSWPLERIRSGGGMGPWVALITAVCVSCLPIASVLASTHGGGGASHGGGSHISGAHSLSGGSSHFRSSPFNNRIVGSGHFTGSRNVAKTHPSVQLKNESPNLGRHLNSGAQTDFYSRSTSFRTVNPHRTTLDHQQSKVGVHHERTANRFTSQARDLPPKNAGKATITHAGSANQFISASRDLTQTNARNARNSLKARTAQSSIAYNHSLTASYAQSLMNQRLNRISNRQWTGHGTFYANHADRDHHCWFHHRGLWWRCNYWGAHRYCNHPIVLGFAPGLCWAWYDNICWGNIMTGMPLDLVDYYYPESVYSRYTDYEGQDAIVYYYATDNGQYWRVTVVDGNVVNVEVVDYIFRDRAYLADPRQ